MTLGPEWLAALLALAAVVVALAVLAYACLRVLLEIRRQNAEAAAALRAIQQQLAASRPGDQRALTQVLLEGGLRELRRLAGLTHASLETSVRELGRVADSTSAAAVEHAEVLPPPGPAAPPAALAPSGAPASIAALVVVRRDQPQLYELFRQTTDHVAWDRRRAERRARVESLPTDRRRRERRRRPPATWSALGFLITSGGPPPRRPPAPVPPG